MKKQLHIVSFNIPYPPNYGGVIDVYYKIKALSNLGIDVHLHAFEYGREPADELNELCASVQYYRRRKSFKKLVSPLPFIVRSRDDSNLLNNLSKIDCPILFEGLHSTFYLDHPQINRQLKVVRLHNIEWQYYNHLASLESNVAKRVYHESESSKLEKYEDKLESAQKLICISNNDLKYYASRHKEVYVVPAFHQNNTIEVAPGTGEYILYHGDLSVKDNEQSATFLVKEVFSKLDYPAIIAGLNPSKKLVRLCNKYDQISLRENPTQDEMQTLVREAQINVLYSFQSAGMKLKVLNALFQGRHCIVNSNMVDIGSMGDLCEIVETPQQFLKAIRNQFKQSFSDSHVSLRARALKSEFSNDINAQRISDLIFD